LLPVAVAVAANTMKAQEGAVVVVVVVVLGLPQKLRCQVRLTQLPLVLVDREEVSQLVQMAETQFLVQ
jgi:hypothetical protein